MSPGDASGPASQAAARLHAQLRFAAGVTAAFVLCEVMAWQPSFLAAVLTGALLANLPMRPPLKLGIGLVLTMTIAALYAATLSLLLRATPTVMFGAIGLSMFVVFHGLASGRPALPGMLMLICLALVPVVVMVAPAQVGVLPTALIRGMAIGVLMVWSVHALWPRLPERPAAPAATPHAVSALALALLSTAVVLPLMLVYLLFGLADVLPVMAATVLIVISFNPEGGRKQALGMVLANFIGGLAGLLLHSILMTTPTLPFLTGLLFLALWGFARVIVAGGPMGGVALVACNGMLIIFGSAIASGPSSLSLWLVRVFQFALAGAFAVGMMSLLWQWATRIAAQPTHRATR